MAIYSLPLAAVLVTSALRDDRHPRAMGDLVSSDHTNNATDRSLRTLVEVLDRVRRRVRRLRVKMALERGAAITQLHEADAQIAHAQLQMSADERMESTFPEKTRRADDTFTIPQAIKEPSIAIALQHLELEIMRKKKLLLRARLHESMDDVTVDVQRSVGVINFQLDELQTRHHAQLSTFYEQLVKKRLHLRAIDRGCKRNPPTEPTVMTQELTRAIATKLRLEDDDDVGMAMLEEAHDDALASEDDTPYDGDVDDEDLEEVHIAYKEASI